MSQRNIHEIGLMRQPNTSNNLTRRLLLNVQSTSSILIVYISLVHKIHIYIIYLRNLAVQSARASEPELCRVERAGSCFGLPDTLSGVVYFLLYQLVGLLSYSVN